MCRNVLFLLVFLSSSVSVFFARPTYRIITRHSAEIKDTGGDVLYRREENGHEVSANDGNQQQFPAEILHRVALGRAGVFIRKETSSTHAATKRNELYDIVSRDKRSKKTHTPERSWNNILSEPEDDWESDNASQNGQAVDDEDELLNRDRDAQRFLKESLSRPIRASTKAAKPMDDLKNRILETVISQDENAKRKGFVQSVIAEDTEEDAAAEDPVKIILATDTKDDNNLDEEDDKAIDDNLKKATEISKAVQTINSLSKRPVVVISQKKPPGSPKAVNVTPVAHVDASTASSISTIVKIPAMSNIQAQENKLKAQRTILKKILKNNAKEKTCESVKIRSMYPYVYVTYKTDHIKTLTNLELDVGYTMINLKALDRNIPNTMMSLEIVLRRTHKLKALYIGTGKDLNGFQGKGSVTKAKLQIKRTKIDEWKSLLDASGFEKVYDVENGVISLRKPHLIAALRIYPQEWIRKPTFYRPKFVICV